jgi:hypothetical protein
VPITTEVWLVYGENYKFVLESSAGTTLAVWDNISRFGDSSFLALSVKDFGAVGNGTWDDTAAIQNALDQAALFQTAPYSTGARVDFPPGAYLVSSSLIIKSGGITLCGSGKDSSSIRFTGTGAAITGNNDGDQTIKAHCKVRDLFFRIEGSGAIGIDFSWFNYSDFESLVINLLSTGQVGIQGTGNESSTGPYYNTFDKITISGNSSTSNTGVQLLPAPVSTASADGPNGNLFTNFHRINSVNVGFDIQSGTGNLGSNINLESIGMVGFAFNDRAADYAGPVSGGTVSSFYNVTESFDTTLVENSAWQISGGTGNGLSGLADSATATQVNLDLYTVTGVPLNDPSSTYTVTYSKAQGNKFNNIRMEGEQEARLAIFYPGALLNTITNVYATSISETQQWVKGVPEGSNWCHVYGAGQLVAVPMWIEGGLNSPSTTYGFHPNTLTSGLGAGYRLVPRGGVVVGMSAACNSLSGLTGSATVSFYNSNAIFHGLDLVLNSMTQYGNTSYLTTLDSTSGCLVKTVNDLDVRLTTSPTWAGGSAIQISVLLWIQV